MIRRIVLLGCLTVAIVLTQPTASNAGSPVDPLALLRLTKPCFPNDARAGCNGNTGPAGPAGASGPSGPAGPDSAGFSVSAVYIKSCNPATFECACNLGSDGCPDIAIGGEAFCSPSALEDIGTSSSFASCGCPKMGPDLGGFCSTLYPSSHHAQCQAGNPLSNSVSCLSH